MAAARSDLVNGLDREHLVGARLVVELPAVVNELHIATSVTTLQDNEDDTVEDEHRGNDPGVMKVFGHPVIKEQADDCRGYATDDDHSPQTPGLLALNGSLLVREGVEFGEVQDDDGHDGADLDDDQK